MSTINDQHRKQLQQLMENPAWGAVEAYLADFMMRNFAQSQSIKRDTDFNTLWYAAENEGGKRFLAQFFREMEEEVIKLNDRA